VKIIGHDVKVPLDRLLAAPRNANRMDAARFAALQGTIAREGFLQPIVARALPSHDYEIVDGHHRVEAVRSLNATRKNDAPVVYCYTELPAVVVDCTDEEAARLAVAMNRLRGELDLSEVGAIFTDLIDAGVDPELLKATGFSADQLDDLIASATAELEESLPAAVDAPEPAEDSPPKVWALELLFGDRKAYERCRRALRRAAGKGEELAVGLLRLVDGEEKEEANE